jgi:hypothetical protein
MAAGADSTVVVVVAADFTVVADLGAAGARMAEAAIEAAVGEPTAAERIAEAEVIAEADTHRAAHIEATELAGGTAQDMVGADLAAAVSMARRALRALMQL